MDLPTEVNDDQVQQTEPMEASSPLDLTVKKRKRSDSETVAETDEKPDAPTTADDDEPSAPGENVKPTTPLDLSRNNKSVTPPPVATGAAGNKSCNVVRPSVVVRSPVATVSPMLQKDYRAPVASPLIADHVSPIGHSAAQPTAATAPYEHIFSEYNALLAAAAAAGATAEPPLPPARPSAAQFHHHHHHLHHQQQQQHQLYLQQQQQIQLQQQQQLQLQIQQLQQQQRLAAYGRGHPFDLNPMMMTNHKMISPLYVATSPPSPTESNQFPFGGFDYFPRSAYNFGYPYFDEILDSKGMSGDCGDGEFDTSSGDRSDCMSPESTSPGSDYHRRSLKMLDDPDVNPEDIAAIYRQSDFVSFRNRYLESLGPPKNFEKMRRSVPNKKLQMSSQHLYDQTYVMKRQKNNEAAKRSRDAKRQKYIENQISVMYLTKKVSEMKEIKRRLLMSM